MDNDRPQFCPHCGNHVDRDVLDRLNTLETALHTLAINLIGELDHGTIDHIGLLVGDRFAAARAKRSLPDG